MCEWTGMINHKFSFVFSHRWVIELKVFCKVKFQLKTIDLPFNIDASMCILTFARKITNNDKIKTTFILWIALLNYSMKLWLLWLFICPESTLEQLLVSQSDASFRGNRNHFHYFLPILLLILLLIILLLLLLIDVVVRSLFRLFVWLWFFVLWNFF